VAHWAVPIKKEKKQLGDVKASASDLAGKVSEIEKELAHVSATLQK